MTYPSLDPPFERTPSAHKSSLNSNYDYKPPKVKPLFSFEEEQKQRIMQERMYDGQNGRLCGEFGISGMPISRESAQEFRQGVVAGEITRLKQHYRDASSMKEMGNPLYTSEHISKIGRRIADKQELLKDMQDFHRQEREMNAYQNSQLKRLGL